MKIKTGLVVLMAATGLLCAVTAFARDTYVHGYTRANGTYVQPYYRTAPNGTKLDNYSTIGNVNPYTGQAGTVDPYSEPAYQPISAGLHTPVYRPTDEDPQQPAENDCDDADGCQ
jgi:hypothetical protein